MLYYFLLYWDYLAAFCLLFYIILMNEWMLIGLRVSTVIIIAINALGLNKHPAMAFIGQGYFPGIMTAVVF